MRLADIGRVFFGLALVLLSAFVLDRGMLIRADVELPSAVHRGLITANI
jgi:hypothetical protein